MTGSCIEDVNHEIYGGLYSQLIFGESFEEPPIPVSPIRGWAAYGGNWRIDGEALHVDANEGGKLVNDTIQLSDGSISCDVKLNDNTGANAALLVRVTDPHTGADNWNGYEISISARDRNVAIHRHHHDWHLLKAAPADIKPGQWTRLTVHMLGEALSVRLNDDLEPAIEFADTVDPLKSGQLGLRTWGSEASFRNITVNRDVGRPDHVPFHAALHADSGVSGMWDAIHSGTAKGEYSWDADNPFNSEHSQRIVCKSGGSGVVGVANGGLNRWGISVRAGHTLGGKLYLREQDLIGSVSVALQNADGSRTYSKQRILHVGLKWEQREFRLNTRVTDPNARLAIWIDQPGTIWVDQVTLMPTGDDLFHKQPVRADIADSLEREGVKFLRYGGTMVNAPTYKFKNMLGDRDKRPQVKGNWYPYSTNGFGIEEFIQFCEAAHIEPAFAINIDETAQNAADMVEYLNGPAESPWGKRRALNGHKAPYGVRYIEIGNEEAIDGNKEWYRRYLERFEALEPAMHAKDPDLQLVIAAWWRSDEPLCRDIAQRLNGKAALWDVHVGGDGLRDGYDVDQELTTMQARLQEWAPGTSLKACIFEENGGRHDIQRALGHAHILNVTERHGDFVKMDCPANCLQPWLQNDNGWDQGQLFFTPDKVWGMPPYYAQQMAAQNYEPLCVQCAADRPNHVLDVSANSSEDAKTLVLKIVNLGSSSHKTQITLDGFTNLVPSAKTRTLSGKLTAVNTPAEPLRVVPVEGAIAVAGGKFEVDVKAYSYVVIRTE